MKRDSPERYLLINGITAMAVYAVGLTVVQFLPISNLVVFVMAGTHAVLLLYFLAFAKAQRRRAQRKRRRSLQRSL